MSTEITSAFQWFTSAACHEGTSPGGQVCGRSALTSCGRSETELGSALLSLSKGQPGLDIAAPHTIYLCHVTKYHPLILLSYPLEGGRDVDHRGQPRRGPVSPAGALDRLASRRRLTSARGRDRLLYPVAASAAFREALQINDLRRLQEGSSG